MAIVKSKIYQKLVSLGIVLEDQPMPDHRKSKASGFMDLVVENTPDELPSALSGKGYTFSLTHYFSQNGDLCKDPDMIIFVDTEAKQAESICFEMSLPPLYQRCYEGEVLNKRIQAEQHEFLNMWLDNLKGQGHCVNWEQSED